MNATLLARSQQFWAWSWTAWAASAVSSFVFLERAALRRNTHPTLSTTLRRVLGIHPRHWWGPPLLFVLAAFWTWLEVHLALVPEDVHFGPEPPPVGLWVEVAPGLWYQMPRRRRLV